MEMRKKTGGVSWFLKKKDDCGVHGELVCLLSCQTPLGKKDGQGALCANVPFVTLPCPRILDGSL